MERMARNVKRKAAWIEENRRAYDLLYDVVTDRGRVARHALVERLERRLADTFAEDLSETAPDPAFREVFREFFDQCWRDDSVGCVLQLLLVYSMLVLDAGVRDSFCPAPPDPDTDEPDRSRVDRAAFVLFEQAHLRPLFNDLMDGTDVTVPAFVRELNGHYAALLPADPLLEVAAASGRRNRRAMPLLETRAADQVTK